MRLALTILSISALSGSLYAQNTIEIWPGATSFTSRGNIGTGDGETLQGFHSSHWVGLGNRGRGCSIAGLSGGCQDQNASTQEKFDWVIRGGTDAAGPDIVAPELFRVIGLSTPPSAVTTPALVGLTSAFATPAKIPCDKFIAVGLGLYPTPGWSGDGLSTHASRGFQSTANLQFSGAQQQEHAWQVVGTGGAGVVSHPSQGRTWRYSIDIGSGPAMQVGNEDGAAAGLAFGMGGMFPDTLAGTQQWGAGITYAAGPAESATLLISISQSPAPIPIGTAASLWLNPALLLPAGTVVLDGNGEGEIVVVNPLAATVTGLITAQAVVLGGSGINLTNGNHVSFN